MADVRVTLLAWSRAAPAHADALAASLPACERERAAAMAGMRRGPFVAARALARWRLAARLGCAPQAAAITCEPSGRPFVAAPCAGGISISHTAGWVAFAEAPCAVGVDVEAARMDRAVELAQAWLAPSEAQAVAGAADPAACLRRIWTAKEAVLKALGTGLALAPAAFAVPPALWAEAPGEAALPVVAQTAAGAAAAGFAVRRFAVDAACDGAVAVPLAWREAPVVVARVTLEQLADGLADLGSPPRGAPEATIPGAWNGRRHDSRQASLAA